MKIHKTFHILKKKKNNRMYMTKIREGKNEEKKESKKIGFNKN